MSNDLFEEARRRGAAQRAAQGLPPMITDPVILRLAAEALASATPTTAPAPADPAAVVGIGAAGPHGTGTFGEVGPNVGQSAQRRPAAPTTNKTPAVAAAGVQNSAG